MYVDKVMLVSRLTAVFGVKHMCMALHIVSLYITCMRAIEPSFITRFEDHKTL